MIGVFAFVLAAQAQPISAQIAANPYGPAAQAATGGDALIRDAVFGAPGAAAILARWLGEHPDASPDQRGTGYGVLCNIYGAYTWHSVSATACAAAPKKEGQDDAGVARALAAMPPVRAEGTARIPLHWNALGVQDIPASVGDVDLPWLVDTGAGISVLSQSSADRLKPHYVEGQFSVGTSTDPVIGRVAMIDLLRIGTATVENVPVLVLPDAQLAIGGGKVLPAILGLQVLNAFRRVAWVDHAKYLVLGESARRAQGSANRLYWHDEGVGVPIGTGRGLEGAFLDTGANSSLMRPSGLTLLSPAERTSAVQKKVGLGGAGGMVTRTEAEYPSLSFSIAGAPVRLSKVSMDMRDNQGAALLGMDMVSQFDLFLLDFETMRITVHRAAPGAMPRR